MMTKMNIRSSVGMMSADSLQVERVMARYPVGYMRRGDHIYVGVMQNGRRVLEFSVNNVESYTELMGEIRYAGQDLNGLSKVFIRNKTRGWSEERPIKFYNGLSAPRGRRMPGLGRMVRPSATRMLAPWETH